MLPAAFPKLKRTYNNYLDLAGMDLTRISGKIEFIQSAMSVTVCVRLNDRESKGLL